MEYRFAARPTTYKDVTFRSRLEARWAATFDALGLRWEYEPFDLDGWVPDFLLPDGWFPTLVEIKPIHEFDRDVAAKLNRAPPQYGRLLAGCALPIRKDQHPCDDGGLVGWLYDPRFREWGPAYVTRAEGPRPCLFNGEPMPRDEIRRAWAEAGNATRWRPRA